MKNNPLHYEGVVRQDDDDELSFSESRSHHRSPFNISSTGRSSTATAVTGSPASSVIQWLDMSLEKAFILIAYISIFILFIIAVVYLSDINQSLKSSDNCITSSSMISMSDLTLISPDNSKSTGFKAYTDNNKSNLYWRIPSNIVDNDIDILLVEQLTSGLGIRELFIDPGSVISQDIVEFRKHERLNQLDLVLLQQSYRSDDIELIEKSYSVSILYTFDILNINIDGYLIKINEFMLLTSIGYIHGNTIPSIIASHYGMKYNYMVDLQRSSINIDTSHTNTYRGYINRQFTYYLATQNIFPPANIGKQFSLSSRITFLWLDKYAELCSIHAGQLEYTSDHPRPYLPMSSFNYISYMNESADLLQARQEVYITRHRLYNMTTTSTSSTSSTSSSSKNYNIRTQKKIKNNYHTSSTISNSNQTPATATTIQKHTQLIYYIDTSTPSYISEALIKGINWWDEAFQEAGYPAGTFIATTAPTALDPYDFTIPKFNYVEYINRNYRSYSLGIRVINPKTGEILKGHVRIENLRMKQDALIAEVLLGPFHDNDSSSSTTATTNIDSYTKQNNQETLYSSTTTTTTNTNPLQTDILNTIMQRVSQLGAHEVGHTIGLAHNYAGSTSRKGYSSVMDYPPPIVTIDTTTTSSSNTNNENNLVLNKESYSNHIGIYDKIAILYGYSNVNHKFINKNEEYEYLNNILQYNIVNNDYVYLTDEDSSVDSADWHGTQWDSGNNPILSLNNSLKIRSIGLKKLEDNMNVLAIYTAYSKIQELLPLVYLWHRYEIVAVSKLLGGYLYQYNVRGSGSSSDGFIQPRLEYIPGRLQLAALDQLLEALRPSALALSPALVQQILPAAFGIVMADIGGDADLFPTRSGRNTFDSTSSMEICANLVINSIFQPARLERINTQHQLNSTLPSLHTILKKLTYHIFNNTTIYSIIFAPEDNLYNQALITTQSLLINAYLSVQNEPLQSIGVKNIVKLHTNSIVKQKLESLQSDIESICSKYNTTSAEMDSSGSSISILTTEECEERQVLWDSHISSLYNAVVSGKVFMSILQTPLGPPI